MTGSDQGRELHGERVGVFGGTFDPPHIGHLVSAIAVREALELDRVLLVVANVPWQKVGDRDVLAADVRLDLVRAAVADLDGIEASDVEVVRGGNSYSVDTLVQLRAESPSAELFLIVGADAASGLATWARAGELPALAELVVVDRPADSSMASDLSPDPVGRAARSYAVASGLQWAATTVVAPRLEVSSTDLRQRVRDGRSLALLTPPAVVAMIRAQGIYRGAP